MKDKKSESKISAELIKKSFKESWAVHKGLWIVGIVLLVLTVLISVFYGISNTTSFKAKMISHFMTETYVAETNDGRKIEYHYEINPDYVPIEKNNETNEFVYTTDALANMYNFYSIDEEGNKTYVEDEFDSTEKNTGLKEDDNLHGILNPGSQKLLTLSKVIKALAWVAAVAVVVVLILLWYLQDKKYFEKKKATKEKLKAKKEKMKNKKFK